MPGEQRGHQRALPVRPGHFAEHEENQHGVAGVPEQIDQMKTARSRAKQARVQQQRQPGQRMPRAERPARIVNRQSRLNPRILGHVFRVVEIDEVVVDHREVEREREPDQQQTDDNG